LFSRFAERSAQKGEGLNAPRHGKIVRVVGRNFSAREKLAETTSEG